MNDCSIWQVLEDLHLLLEHRSCLFGLQETHFVILQSLVAWKKVDTESCTADDKKVHENGVVSMIDDSGESGTKEYVLRSHHYPMNVKQLQHKRYKEHIRRCHKVGDVLLNLFFLISHSHFCRLEVVFKVVCNLVNYQQKPPHLIPYKLALALLLELEFELDDLPFGQDRLIPWCNFL